MKAGSEENYGKEGSPRFHDFMFRDGRKKEEEEEKEQEEEEEKREKEEEE